MSGLTFYLADDFGLNVSGVLAPDVSGAVTSDFSADATAQCDVSLSVVKNAFQMWSDSVDLNNLTAEDLMWKLAYDLEINPKCLTPNFVNNTAMSENALLSTAKNMLPDDFLRHIALQYFNSIKGVDLFSNESELLDSIATQCVDAFDARLLAIAEAGVHDSEGHAVSLNEATGEATEGEMDADKNPSKKIGYHMIHADRERFSDMSALMIGESNWFQLPFLVGDKIVFPITIECPADANGITSNTNLDSRKYKVIMNVVA